MYKKSNTNLPYMESAWLDFKTELKKQYQELLNNDMLINDVLTTDELLFKYFYILRQRGFEAAINFVKNTKIPESFPKSNSFSLDQPPRCLFTHQCTLFCPYYYQGCSNELAPIFWTKLEKAYRPIVPEDL